MLTEQRAEIIAAGALATIVAILIIAPLAPLLPLEAAAVDPAPMVRALPPPPLPIDIEQDFQVLFPKARSVPTVAIKSDDVPEQEVFASMPEPAVAPPAVLPESDVCTRHRMHRVSIGHNKWRCRR